MPGKKRGRPTGRRAAAANSTGAEVPESTPETGAGDEPPPLEPAGSPPAAFPGTRHEPDELERPGGGYPSVYARKEIEVGYSLLVMLTLNRQTVCASGTCSILHRAKPGCHSVSG